MEYKDFKAHINYMSFFLEYIAVLDGCDFSKEWWSTVFKNHSRYVQFQKYGEIVAEMDKTKQQIIEIRQKYVEFNKNDATITDDFMRIKMIDEKSRIEKEIRLHGNEYVRLEKQRNNLLTLYPEFKESHEINCDESLLIEKWNTVFGHSNYKFENDENTSCDELGAFVKEKCDGKSLCPEEPVVVEETVPTAPVVSIPEQPAVVPANDFFYFMSSFMWGHFLWYLLMYIPFGNLTFDFCGVLLFLVWCQNMSKKMNSDVGKMLGSISGGTDLQLIKLNKQQFLERYVTTLYTGYSVTVDVTNDLLNGTYFSEMSVVVGGLFVIKMIYPFFNFNNVLWVMCQMVSYQSIPEFNKKGLVSFLKMAKAVNLEVKKLVEKYTNHI